MNDEHDKKSFVAIGEGCVGSMATKASWPSTACDMTSQTASYQRLDSVSPLDLKTTQQMQQHMFHCVSFAARHGTDSSPDSDCYVSQGHVTSN